MSSEVPPYEVRRHAQVLAEPQWEQLSFVLLGVWSHPDGRQEWCLEYIDASHGPVGDDECFDSQEAALTAAERAFGISRNEWRDGYPAL